MVWLITDSLIGRPLLFTEKESELAKMGIRFTQVTPIDCGFALVAIGWTIRA